jgi:hypothetical protein
MDFATVSAVIGFGNEVEEIAPDTNPSMRIF